MTRQWGLCLRRIISPPPEEGRCKSPRTVRQNIAGVRRRRHGPRPLSGKEDLEQDREDKQGNRNLDRVWPPVVTPQSQFPGYPEHSGNPAYPAPGFTLARCFPFRGGPGMRNALVMISPPITVIAKVRLSQRR